MNDKQTSFFSVAIIILIFAMVAMIKVITDNTAALESNYQAEKILIGQNKQMLSKNEMIK